MFATTMTLGSRWLVLACAATLGVLATWPAAAQSGPKASDLVKAELVAEPSAIMPGEPFTVAVSLRAKEHWHTYWRNPGDSGIATEIAWNLPPGFAAGPIEWPAPERIVISGIVNYGYEGETMLLTRITPPADAPAGRPMKMRAKVNYLVCERECIPGEADLAVTLPVASGMSAIVPAARRARFEAARAALPVLAPGTTRATVGADIVSVRAEGLDAASAANATFLPYDGTLIDNAAPQQRATDGGALTLTVPKSQYAAANPGAEVGGLLLVDGAEGRRAYAFGPEPAVGSPQALDSANDGAEAAPATTDVSLGILARTALFALLGGLILNLMPCVFPILSIKVLSLVRHSGESAGRVRLHGLVYTAGVVATFVMLAGILLTVRAGGATLGWGFQLQSPVLVASLAFLLLAMGLSLSGVASFGTSLGGIGGGLADRAGLPGSFFTGILATIVATPCTAPFMGAAVGFAVTASAPVALAIFAALGLGMALPFLLLTIWPSLVARLPRPGAWMERLKQLLAFPLYVTVAWLVFVLAQQVAPETLFGALIGLVAVAFAVWAWGEAPTLGATGRRIAQGGAALGAAGVVAFLLAVAAAPPAASPAQAASAEGVQPYSQARLDALRADGKPVFVNLTAAWCITCLVNERTTLSSAPVRDAFRERGVTYLKGDWTNQNPEITRLLERNGRSGVPLYLLYAGRGEPVVLPQILTQGDLLESLRQIGATRADFGANTRERL